ncbi:MAG: RidA family protein [Planctomycetota bacterium]
MGFEDRLEQLGLELPPAPKAIGLYRSLTVVGTLAYTSGHGPLQADKTLICGRVGDELTVEEGYAAARQTGLAVLATLRAELGSLDRIKRLVKTFGLVRATPELTEHPAVINGFSELMREVFGEEHGVAARSAVGAASLPAGMAVEVEAIFELTPETP